MTILLGAVLGLAGCQAEQPAHEMVVREQIALAESEVVPADWIGIAVTKIDEKTFFERVLELRHPIPRAGSLGLIRLRGAGSGKGSPTVTVFQGTNRWAEENRRIGEFRLTEWPWPGQVDWTIEVGFRVTAEQSLVMWVEGRGRADADASQARGRRIPLEKVEMEAASPAPGAPPP